MNENGNEFETEILTEKRIKEIATSDELLSEELFDSLFDVEEEVKRARLIITLQKKAKELRCTKEADTLLRAYKAEEKKISQQYEGGKLKDKPRNEKHTDFGDRYPAMKCGDFDADMSGIYNPNVMPSERCVCPHPILPAEVITNVEDGTQKVRLAFCRSGVWREHIVPKTIIANRSKISDLAGIGVAVTSESAKGLVRYLAEVEQLNLDIIPEVRATAKMGWCEDGFMPYTSELAFDKDGRFDTLYSTISTSGSRKKWMDFMLSVRASGRVEPRLTMAASLASVLIKPCGLLPFWVDIWGRTGGGKSICGMIAASVWADPEIGKYISKFDSTISAFEARAGFLNNLPFVIDDTAEIRRRLKDDFSQLIYQLASGEGRERSNTKLGLAHKTTWANVIICSGESPIITDQLQGGAVNRLLEYEVDEGNIFEDGQTAAAILKSNYGFIGREFVDILEKIGADKLMQLQQECFAAIRDENYEDKQMRSLSAIILADRIATQYIFKDDKALTFDEVKKCLTDKNTLSENQRCYEYIIGICTVNENNFIPDTYGNYKGERWGKYITQENGTVECIAILPLIYRKICADGGFSSKAFTKWAIKQGLLYPDSEGCGAKRINKGDDRGRYYVLKLPD